MTLENIVTTRTTCPYCGVGCGVRARVSATQVELDGDAAHPANAGRLCSKGTALAETLGLDGRLLYPHIGRDQVSWDAALARVADGFGRVIAEHGLDAVAFYVSGQLLTEDYYVANKLMKGYIGAANIDTNSRLCMASAVAGHKRAFGEDVVPVSYRDIEVADLVVLVGSNTAWCHPVLFKRISEAQERGDVKVVVIDPRRTATCEIADLHLPVRAGTDVWLFNGLLAFLHQRGVVHTQFVAAHTVDADRALVVADNTAGDVNAVAKICRVDPGQLRAFYQLFARHERVVTVFSQGVNQSSAGTDKVNSIVNCHLLTGRIGRPGMGPFSITGQPNAMGGREVGGLANTLAAHLGLEDAADRTLVQDFWGSPTIAQSPGLKAVDLFEAIHAGKVKALWIMATNPLVSLPNADRARAALERCDLVVVSDCVADTDTSALAHVRLPAAAWGEKDGTVTNSERCISRQRAFLPQPGETRPDWWIICEVAKRMGFPQGFEYTSPHSIFVEHARLSGTGNAGTRAFDISGLQDLNRAQYDALEPAYWPLRSKPTASLRPFDDGRFYHADGKARLVPTPPRAVVHAPDDEYPLILNTGRLRDQWHTMTRTGTAPRLTAHTPEPYVAMHPQDALLAGAHENELARVSTRWGSVVVRVRVEEDLPRGMIFVPIHWNDVFCSDGRVGALVNPAVDPISGQPEFKHTPARVAAFTAAWHGFVLSRKSLAVADVTWWARAQGAQFQRYELAGRRVHGDWSAWWRRLLDAHDADADWLEYVDRNAGVFRAALLVNERIEACVSIAPRPNLASRTWLGGLFAKERLGDRDRAGLLIGQPADGEVDSGPTICSCYGVGRASICAAIEKHALSTVQEVGEVLKAGTNCGSCQPEIKTLLAQARASDTR